MLERMLSSQSTRDNAQLTDRVYRMMAATPVAGILGAIGAMRDRPDSFPLLPTLSGLPALIVVGDDDHLAPVDRAQAMVDALPGARLAVVPGAGHLTSMERADATTGLLADFLASLGRPA
jgi:pimeloyl-ACP methyl ester carboxylesterase